MKGNMTVEAACIFPFCFLIILFVCCIGIFQYNQAVLKITGYECILRTMEERELEEKSFKTKLQYRAEETASARTFGLEDITVSVKKTATKISLCYKGVQKMLESPMEVEVAYEIVHPELTLRAARNVLGEMNEGNIKEGAEQNLPDSQQ